jgi:uncharacterized protein (DUF169 family)
MDKRFMEYFTDRWRKYFSGADLPICFYYTDEVPDEERLERGAGHRCLICNLDRVREGRTYVYHAMTPGCPGGKRYSGFVTELRPDFEYFLSCGIPGKMAGERYKKCPELVRQFLQISPAAKAPAQFLVFKRWDKLLASEQPLAVVFFAKPDVLAGLFTLANYDLGAGPGVVTPMGSGCSTILSLPLREAQADQPKCILGMFDISARPCVPADTLTFTIPWQRFQQMAANMDESFLVTESWAAVRARL